MNYMYRFSNKADNLESVIHRLTKATVLPLISFSVLEWSNNKNEILNRIKRKFNEESYLIIRSSACDEDTLEKSNAGKYTSVLNVINERQSISLAIDNVISSYSKRNLYSNKVLIQPMITDFKYCGVVFTHDIIRNTPYYTISLSSQSTDSVTGGYSDNYYVEYVLNCDEISSDKFGIIPLMKELESITHTKYLDVEIIITDEQLILTQIRPLVHKDDYPKINEIHENLLKTKVKRYYSKAVKGDRVLYSNMTDWNPAELVGKHPMNFDYSIYYYLFTRKAWSEGRKCLGYKDVGFENLTFMLYGYPYVDVKLSTNSYLPAGLTESLEEKLVNIYMDKLLNNYNLHDKYEFDIVQTCFTPLSEKVIYGLNLNNIEKETYCKCLLEMTNNILKYENAFKSYEKVKDYVPNLTDADSEIIDLLNWIELNYCIPYSTIVRQAFVAYKELADLKQIKLLTEKEFSCIINSINSITKQQRFDSICLLRSKISKEEFKNKYRFVKENMFSINGNYTFRDEKYIESLFNIECNYLNEHVTETIINEKEINHLFSDIGLNIDINGLIELTRKSFYYREEIKLSINRLLNIVYSRIKKTAQRMNLESELIPYITLYDLFRYKNNRIELIERIESSKKEYEKQAHVLLPDIFSTNGELTSFVCTKNTPNFVTNRKVKGKVIVYNPNQHYENYANKIVVIERADPGYDWLFNCGICGLITCYGGTASHISLRSYELGLPAVIGCGSILYEKISNSNEITIDCKNKRIYADRKILYK